MVLATAVLSFTYTCPTTSDPVAALADAVAVPATASAISPIVVAIRLSKRMHVPPRVDVTWTVALPPTKPVPEVLPVPVKSFQGRAAAGGSSLSTISDPPAPCGASRSLITPPSRPCGDDGAPAARCRHGEPPKSCPANRNPRLPAGRGCHHTRGQGSEDSGQRGGPIAAENSLSCHPTCCRKIRPISASVSPDVRTAGPRWRRPGSLGRPAASASRLRLAPPGSRSHSSTWSRLRVRVR